MKALIATRISGLEAANKALRSENAERERIEASLRQAQRIKAAGRLTGSIAHDFSNMLQAISANLEMMGRRVEERRLDEAVRFVESAGAAVERASALTFLAAPVRIDLLVTDLGLPNGSNGRLVADAARERRPDLPVLFITGYAGSALERQLAPGMQVIGKPFMLETLAAQVGALIGRIMDPAMS